MSDHVVNVTNYDEGVEAFLKFDFPQYPLRIRDTTSLSDDPHYPEQCTGETSARLRLDWIFEFHHHKPVKVEISGRPKTMAQHIKENGS